MDDNKGGEKSSSSSFEDLSNLKEEDLNPPPEKSEDDGVIDIFNNGQLVKKILEPGQDDTRPERNSLCRVTIEGRLESGFVVEKLDNIWIQLGDYDVIQGLDMAIPLMNVGEKAEIVVSSRFAYGSMGLKNEEEPDKSIPADAAITYTVQLLAVKEEEDQEEFTYETRKKIGNMKRERGNFWFERNEYNMAIQCYRKALDFLDEGTGEMLTVPKHELTKEQLQDLLEDRMKTHNNLAMAQMKISAWEAALKSVDTVLRCKPENVKALFRKGKILDTKGEVNNAIPLLQRAATLDPENRQIQNELSKMILKSKREARNEKDLYQKMLGHAQKMEQKSKVIRNEEVVGSKFKLWGYLLGTILAGVAGIAMYRYKYF